MSAVIRKGNGDYCSERPDSRGAGAIDVFSLGARPGALLFPRRERGGRLCQTHAKFHRRERGNRGVCVGNKPVVVFGIACDFDVWFVICFCFFVETCIFFWCMEIYRGGGGVICDEIKWSSR